MKTCMVTGHREIPVGKIEDIKAKLRSEVLLAIEDGFTNFISGFADGTDLIFADIIVALKGTYPITLEAAIPYRNRMKALNRDFRRLTNECDTIRVHSEEYLPSCFIKRNRFMVENAERVIAVFDGRDTGGTRATLRYAHALKKDIRVIAV